MRATQQTDRASDSRAGAGAGGVMLSLEDVSKAYPGVRALRDVGLEVRAGEIHGLLGQNGAGKSTLVKIMAGVERPDSGILRLDGVEQRFRSPHDAQQAGIHTIFQELSLVPQLSVAENVYLSDLPRTRLGTVDWQEVHRSAAGALKSVGFDFGADRPVRSLSIAEQQGVEIAKAMHHEAKVLLLDEPTATLPKPDVEALFALLQRLKQEGNVAIIFISHRLEEVYEICDRVTILRDGQRIKTASTAEIDAAGVVRSMVGSKLSHGMVGDNLAGKRRRFGSRTEGRPAVQSPALKVESLSDGSVLHNVSLEVRPGESVGVAGLVGSGLTELAACLFGNRPRTQGRTWVHGKRVTIDSPRQAIAAGVGLLPEDRKGQGLVLGMNVTQNGTMASLGSVSSLSLLSGRREIGAVGRLVQQLRIKVSGLEQRVGTLSGGNQQKVVLAKWLLADVDVLIVHEPTRGIDVNAKEEIYDAIGDFLDRGGAALMLSSEIGETLMCDRVHVMSQGRITAHFDHDDVDSDRLLSLLR